MLLLWLMTCGHLQLSEPSTDQYWHSLLKETELYAAFLAFRFRWRGDFNGVLPGGHTPGSIAAQAIADLLQENKLQPLPAANPSPPPSFLASWPDPDPDQPDGPDTIIEPDPDDPTFFPTLSRHPELQRRVRQYVDRLRHLKENFVLRNEPDLAPFFTDDDDTIRIIETLPDPAPGPDRQLLLKESGIEVARFQTDFKHYLGKQRRLIRFFDFLCDDLGPRHVIAGKLKLSARRTTNLRHRLLRKLRAFFSRPKHASTLVSETLHPHLKDLDASRGRVFTQGHTAHNCEK
jgi:hypothetical protein